MFVRTEPAHVNDSGAHLGLTRTPARTEFKQDSGQNNHFLVTILVGLDAVRAGDVELNEEFSTSWNPQDKTRSAVRSRAYALITSLVWITDLVDVYRKQLQRLPSIFSARELEAIDKCDGRVERLLFAASALGLHDSESSLLMTQFAFRWRNTAVHSDVDHRLSSSLKAALLKSEEAISGSYRGLNIQRSICSFEEGARPTFKEVASFIAAAQSLVDLMDASALKKMSVEKYAEAKLVEHLSFRFTKNPQVFSQYWPGNHQKSNHRLTNLLKNLGFSQESDRVALSADYIEAICKLAARDARKRFSSTA